MRPIFYSLAFILIFLSCSTESSDINGDINPEEPSPVGLTYIPDDDFEQWLIDNDYDDVMDDYARTEKVSQIEELCIEGYTLNDLTGLKDFSSLKMVCIYDGDFKSVNLTNSTELESLTLWGNLENIDLTKNIHLDYLNLSGSKMIELDLSANHKLSKADLRDNLLENIKISDESSLEVLILSRNKLVDLDLSTANDLNSLFIDSNRLEFLDLRENWRLESLNAEENNIECILVSNILLYVANSWSVDEDAKIGIYCSSNPDNPSKSNHTFIPDENFEKALIDYGYDDVLDGFVLTSNITNVKEINTLDDKIHDLKGIEDFKNLEKLTIYNGHFTHADFSDNPKLNFIYIFGAINNVKLTQNHELQYLNLGQNDLSTINLSGNPKLITVMLGANNLSDIDLSSNPLLRNVGLSHNNLNELNLSNNSEILELFLNYNSLESLIIDNISHLHDLKCSDNKIKELDVSNNQFLDDLNTINNDLTCIKVSQKHLNGYISSWHEDSGVEYSLNCDE